MHRRELLKKIGLGMAAAPALMLPIGVQKLVEGSSPPSAKLTMENSDPLLPFMQHHVGWKWQNPFNKEQYGAAIYYDDGAPGEVIADIMKHQMAETIVEVVGNRRALAMAKRMLA